MSSSFLEIIRLANGEIVLKRAGDSGEPIVNIRFSADTKEYLGGADVEVAKAMIQAGLQAVAAISESARHTVEHNVGMDEVAFEELENNEEGFLH